MPQGGSNTQGFYFSAWTGCKRGLTAEGFLDPIAQVHHSEGKEGTGITGERTGEEA